MRIGRESEVEWRAATGAKLDALAAVGHPVIDIVLRDGQWLGGEFFRWEFATAVAGIVLGVNPFDEPNVTESKENTKAVLEQYHDEGHLPADEPLATSGHLQLVGDAALRLTDADGDRRRAAATAPGQGEAERLPRHPRLHRADAGAHRGAARDPGAAA